MKLTNDQHAPNSSAVFEQCSSLNHITAQKMKRRIVKYNANMCITWYNLQVE